MLDIWLVFREIRVRLVLCEDLDRRRVTVRPVYSAVPRLVQNEKNGMALVSTTSSACGNIRYPYCRDRLSMAIRQITQVQLRITVMGALTR